MKPAPSIIGFTTASGFGYGLLFVLAVGGATGLVPAERWFGVVAFILAFGAITGGLLSSTFHLGHPERAWRALSQWRTSWLSREGVAALLTYIPALLLAAGWIVGEEVSGMVTVAAVTAALLAPATVYCTGMIYQDLPPIRAWHQPLTAPVYLAFALMTGLLALQWLLTLFFADAHHMVVGFLVLVATAGAFALKIIYWRRVRSDAADGPSISSATGLGASGLVRMLDPPHTQTNYLLDEMGFRIARKHARRLRMLSLAFGMFGPLILTVVTISLSGWPAMLTAFFAFVSGMLGVLIERWLFFAEAEHTVMLYYGGSHASLPERRPSSNKAGEKVERSQKPAGSRSTHPTRRRRAPTNPNHRVQVEDQAAER